MEDNKLENLSYKDLVRHLIEQIRQTNACFNALDERERIIQKQIERMQVTLDHKTEKEDFVKLSQQVTDFIVTNQNTELVKNKKSNDSKLARALNNKWILTTVIAAITFGLTQLFQYWPK